MSRSCPSSSRSASPTSSRPRRAPTRSPSPSPPPSGTGSRSPRGKGTATTARASRCTAASCSTPPAPAPSSRSATAGSRPRPAPHGLPRAGGRGDRAAALDVPSTAQSTIGGFLSGGSGGTGSIAHGSNWQGFVTALDIALPGEDELVHVEGDAAQPFVHTYGTAGVIAGQPSGSSRCRTGAPFYATFPTFEEALTAVRTLRGSRPGAPPGERRPAEVSRRCRRTRRSAGRRACAGSSTPSCSTRPGADRGGRRHGRGRPRGPAADHEGSRCCRTTTRSGG